MLLGRFEGLRKRRLSSETEEGEELSLTEYIRRKQEEESTGPKKKRVRRYMCTLYPTKPYVREL